MVASPSALSPSEHRDFDPCLFLTTILRRRRPVDPAAAINPGPSDQEISRVDVSKLWESWVDVQWSRLHAFWFWTPVFVFWRLARGGTAP